MLGGISKKRWVGWRAVGGKGLGKNFEEEMTRLREVKRGWKNGDFFVCVKITIHRFF